LQELGISSSQLKYLTTFSADGAVAVSQVPEPSSLVLSGCALGALLVLRGVTRRR
jgi:hypothetical protein